ncbi:sodium-translocating pyrophosphatase [Hippea jasoniae]|uniref:sodium-translocating pyrophosphatase n=1 Tax=Hippea jasoniae TaxID=944479 RepID=UPI00068AF74D|nr:sodium-translocating pyrophosphatase [Hippea jasoniae]
MINPTTALYLTFLASFLSIGYALFTAYYVLSQDDGNDRMKEIAKAIQEGAAAFLAREYKSIAIVAVIIFAILWALGAKSEHFGFLTAIGYLTGAILSGLAGFIGMFVAVRTNVKTAQMAKNGLARALNLAFKGGSVTGFLVTGFGLLAIAGFYYVAVYLFKQPVEHTIKALIGLAFGTSLISVFARLGGGIYTKAADVGADLVGKVEAGIPEDDPRNPAVIADNVGDNVGDCAGMAADVFETFTVTTVAAMVLGHTLFDKPGVVGIAAMFPLLIGAIASVSAIIGTFFVKLPKSNNIMGAFYKGMLATAIIALVVIYFAAQKFFAGGIAYSWGTVTPTNIFISALIGMAITALLMFITEYYTSYEYNPVKSIAKASVTGHATNIIQGMAVMLKAPALPAIVIALGMFFSYKLAGLYGIAIAAAAMLSLTGMVISIDSYGPITDNAGGIAEMAELDETVRAVTDPLDAVGNTTKAVTKGFAIGSAALAALVLFAEYTRSIGAGTSSFDLSNPLVLVGLLLGGLLPFYFGAMSMEAVGVAGGMMVEEVRRQFKTIKGILEGKAKPDYAACVDIVTKESLKKMIAPGLIPVLGPIIVYILFGKIALGALSMGAIITGFFLAVSMTSGGGAWDNAKKYIEDGNFGGKGSEAHKAAVTGDTVGDPLKDTAGPAINPMIKIINIIAILIVLTNF